MVSGDIAAQEHGQVHIVCGPCGWFTPFFDTAEEAAVSWNLRRLREETCRCGQPVESLWQAGEPGATPDYFVLALCAECTTDDPYRSLCAFSPDPYEARRKWRELTAPVILCSVCGEGMRVGRTVVACYCDPCGREVALQTTTIDYSLFA